MPGTDKPNSSDVDAELLRLDGLIEAMKMLRDTDKLKDAEPQPQHQQALLTLVDAVYDQMELVNQVRGGFHARDDFGRLLLPAANGEAALCQ